MRTSLKILALAILLLLSGCSVPKKGGFNEVFHSVHERTDVDIHWYQGSEADVEVRKRVQKLLEHDLSLEETIKIALLNNRNVQVSLENLGVGQADLIQAGLLQNPMFAASVRFPDRPPSASNMEFGLAQSFLDLLLRSSRKRIAQTEFKRVQREVAHTIMTLVSDVRGGYYELQANLEMFELLSTVVETSATAAEFAKRQFEAGTLSELDYSIQAALYAQDKLELVSSQEAMFDQREDLNTLMGLWGKSTDWQIQKGVVGIPEEEPPLEHLESLAIANRLDLEALKYEVEKLELLLHETQKWRLIGTTEVGVSVEREPDKQTVTGPHIALELPIFDQKQAKIARIEAQLRQVRQRAAALAIKIRSDVRKLRNKLLVNRDRVSHYKNTLLPLREQITRLSQKQYNYMLIGVYGLLEAKKQEVKIHRDSIESVKNYWMVRSELERATGANLNALTRKGEVL